MSGASWVAVDPGSGFGLDHLPYGVFSTSEHGPRCGVRIGDHVLDLSRVAVPHGADFAGPTLNAFLGRGPRAWASVRARTTELLSEVAFEDSVRNHLVPLSDVTLHLPWEVADYVDFYSSEHHATNVGRILRPDSPALGENWRHLPIGYHGRAGTVVVSGSAVRSSGRPAPDERPDRSSSPRRGSTSRLRWASWSVCHRSGAPRSRRRPSPSTCSAWCW